MMERSKCDTRESRGGGLQRQRSRAEKRTVHAPPAVDLTRRLRAALPRRGTQEAKSGRGGCSGGKHSLEPIETRAARCRRGRVPAGLRVRSLTRRAVAAAALERTRVQGRYTPRYTPLGAVQLRGLELDHVLGRHRVHPRSEPATGDEVMQGGHETVRRWRTLERSANTAALSRLGVRSGQGERHATKSRAAQVRLWCSFGGGVAGPARPLAGRISVRR